MQHKLCNTKLFNSKGFFNCVHVYLDVEEILLNTIIFYIILEQDIQIKFEYVSDSNVYVCNIQLHCKATKSLRTISILISVAIIYEQYKYSVLL